jgi:hypothetical protein
VVLLGFTVGSARADSSGAGGLSVVPFPGTPDAPAKTQIIFSALSHGDLRSVSVRGSRTGRHAGSLVPLPMRRGTAFVPARPFAPGERVNVTAVLRSAAAAAASGAPGATRFAYSFTISTPAPISFPAATPIPPTPTQSYRSVNDFHPPVVNGVRTDSDTRSGDIFLTPNKSPQVGPLILDARGHLVWFHATRYSSFNLEVQTYRGRRVLTWWQGVVQGGVGVRGWDMIFNHSYQPVAVLHGGNGISSDLHEFQITPQGTALIDAYVPVKANLSSVGGSSNGTIMDSVIQELDIKTNRVLWEWHSLGHVPLSASYVGPPGGGTPYDYFHLNSIQQQPGHRLLISARNTWSVYLIDERTGKIIWTLGGKHSSFQMGSGTNFEWQHDAHLHGHTLSLFDDAGLPQEEAQSSAKRLVINRDAMTASLLKTFIHSPPLLAGAEGSAQLLLGGKMFVSWGNVSNFSEYTASGRQIFNGTFYSPVNTYRAYRFHWTGHPTTRPGLALLPGPDGSLKVYASWNGATQVASWRVLGGTDRKTLNAFRLAPRRRFESVIQVRSEPRYVAVQALDSSGHVLATSPAHRDPPHLAVFGSSAFVGAQDGFGTLPVGCLTRHACSMRLRISSGGSLLASTAPQSIPSQRGALLRFRLSPRGRRMLDSAAHRRLGVQVSASTAAGLRATTRITLIPYSARGFPPPSAYVTPSLQITRTTGFVSSMGAGAILAACYAPALCHIAAKLSTRQGTVIARPKPESLGAEELGLIPFRLNSTGRRALARASGNRLAARLILTTGSDTAAAAIDLVGYR